MNLPRRPDVLCAGSCGTLLWSGTTSLPPGQRTCRNCRGISATSWRKQALCAGGCGKLLWGGTGALPEGERTCRECRGMTRNVGLICAALGCIRPAKTRGMCKTHYNKATGNYIGNWTKDPERERARLRIKTHRRKDWTRLTDITPEYEMALRAKATRCPMSGCGVRMIDEPYQPASKELDHIVPRAAGGTHTIGNVRIICRACNIARPDDGSDYTGPVTLWAEVA